MKITPVTYNPFIIKKGQTNKNSTYQDSSLPVVQASPISMLSFGRSAKNAKALRELMSYKIPDMYSGSEILNPKDLENLISSNVFSGPINKVVEALEPYKQCLHKVEREVFEKIEKASIIHPEKTLAQVMEEMAPEHQRRLRDIQAPVFAKLNTLALQMPDEQQVMYKELIEITNKRLNNEPLSQPFSAKEFNYKLKRIADEINDGNNAEEISVINNIISVAKKMPEKTEVDILAAKNLTSKIQRNKKIKLQRSLTRKRSELLKQIETLHMNSVLNDNYELNRLMLQTRARIYNIPIKTSFNRKSFIYELKKITGTLEDQKLARQMVNTATKLPTSHYDISAFIAKSADYSSSKIGYNLIAPSEGSIEHLIPYIKRGKDLISNYGLTTKFYNSERGDKPMAQYLRLHPEAYANCQKQVDRLIELYNDGTFDKIGLSKWFIINFVQKMYKLSPPEKRMVLDIGKLM